MKIYKVGGAVRDSLLGIDSKDKDWVVIGSTVEEMLSKGFKKVGKNFPVFLHPITNEEYALARTERKSGKGYKGFDFLFTPDITLEEDLMRRDLTINAIAEDEDGKIIDPFNGQADLKNKTFKHVSDAFYEDPLRALRIARFSAQLDDFKIHDDTKKALKKISDGDELKDLSRERVWEETIKASKYNLIQYLTVIIEHDLSSPWFDTLKALPEELDQNLEIAWCQISELNNFKFGEKLNSSESIAKRLVFWKQFSEFDINEDINYKLKFFKNFSQNNNKFVSEILVFFPKIKNYCSSIINEYTQLNFGALAEQISENIETVKINKLKTIIENHE